MNENNIEFTKFIVLKLEDAEDCLSDEQVNNARDILTTIHKYREETGRNPNPTYYVINTDEPYSPEIKAIIEKNEIDLKD